MKGKGIRRVLGVVVGVPALVDVGKSSTHYHRWSGEGVRFDRHGGRGNKFVCGSHDLLLAKQVRS